ncbi:class I SAM-dependent methyltransferase [Bradyrhizobium sp. Gha]|uniref:class I SAM-dependent methyltransferase n=1 Tax=Bradyrhizobium sp. Gha TaxID=1855318 RepID=UPI000B82D7F1|nr:class I SAM-dependent methyltransferase [Bradyrhizobium sp. Gha]
MHPCRTPADNCAHEKLAQNLHNVEFVRADITALSYSDASFDAVVSVFSLFFVADMVAELRELWRVLRPGGKLAITTWGQECSSLFGSVLVGGERVPSRSCRNRQPLGAHHPARRAAPASVEEWDQPR